MTNYTQISIIDVTPPKVKLGGTSYKGTKEGPFELPFAVPHVLAARRWMDAFRVQPLYGHMESEFSDPYFSVGDEGVCEECKDWCIVGKNNTPEVLTNEQLTRIQKMGRLCSEDCALKYVFDFDGGPSIEEVKNDIDTYTTL